MRLTWLPGGWEDYLHWQKEERKVLKRLNGLIRVCLRTPFESAGKPERLKGNLTGWWSRRITREHRLVYRVDGESIVVLQCRFHYDEYLNPWDICKEGVQDHGAKGIVGNRGIPKRSFECSRQFLAAHEIVRIQSKYPTDSGNSQDSRSSSSSGTESPTRLQVEAMAGSRYWTGNRFSRFEGGEAISVHR